MGIRYATWLCVGLLWAGVLGQTAVERLTELAQENAYSVISLSESTFQ